MTAVGWRMCELMNYSCHEVVYINVHNIVLQVWHYCAGLRTTTNDNLPAAYAWWLEQHA